MTKVFVKLLKKILVLVVEVYGCLHLKQCSMAKPFIDLGDLIDPRDLSLPPDPNEDLSMIP
jgi:hypothetical protein